MRGSSPLPNNRVGSVHYGTNQLNLGEEHFLIELVRPFAVFSKKFSQLRIAGPARPQRYASGRTDGRKRAGGAGKARLKKRKALEEDAAKCAKLTDLFSRGQTQVATGKERQRPND